MVQTGSEGVKHALIATLIKPPVDALFRCLLCVATSCTLNRTPHHKISADFDNVGRVGGASDVFLTFRTSIGDARCDNINVPVAPQEGTVWWVGVGVPLYRNQLVIGDGVEVFGGTYDLLPCLDRLGGDHLEHGWLVE